MYIYFRLNMVGVETTECVSVRVRKSVRSGVLAKVSDRGRCPTVLSTFM